jgi:hypothetical protein
MLSRDDNNRKIRTREQRTDVGKYSFVNRTIKELEPITCRLTRVKNVVTSKGIEVGIECKCVK